MTIYLYALKNDKSRLCMKKATFSEVETANLIHNLWELQGFIVNREVEN